MEILKPKKIPNFSKKHSIKTPNYSKISQLNFKNFENNNNNLNQNEIHKKLEIIEKIINLEEKKVTSSNIITIYEKNEELKIDKNEIKKINLYKSKNIKSFLHPLWNSRIYDKDFNEMNQNQLDLLSNLLKQLSQNENENFEFKSKILEVEEKKNLNLKLKINDLNTDNSEQITDIEDFFIY